MAQKLLHTPSISGEPKAGQKNEETCSVLELGPHWWWDTACREEGCSQHSSPLPKLQHTPFSSTQQGGLNTGKAPEYTSMTLDSALQRESNRRDGRKLFTMLCCHCWEHRAGVSQADIFIYHLLVINQQKRHCQEPAQKGSAQSIHLWK